MRLRLRLLDALVAAGLLLASCTSTPAPSPSLSQELSPTGPAPAPASTSTASKPSLPTKASVVDGRFVSSVTLDGGRLRVDPPPAGKKPTFNQSRAEEMIWSSPSLQGSYPGRVFGFGLVTIAPSVGKLTPAAATPAWIGFAWGGEVACPAILSPSPAARLASSGYKAVIIGTRDGFPALAYSARTSICMAPPKGPSLVPATHVVSIEWQSLGIQDMRMNLRYFLPGCGEFFMMQDSGTATSQTIEVDAVVPDVPMPCVMNGWVKTSMQLNSAATVVHAQTGTVRMIQP